MNEVPIEPCRRCGTPKRIDTWCNATQECRDYADRSIAEEHRWVRSRWGSEQPE